MPLQHPKRVRRRILEILYERYLKDPLDMPTPGDLLEDGAIERKDLVAGVHYLNDTGLIELMVGYNPPMFAAARITPAGIDLVENPQAFNLRFPATDAHGEIETADVPLLMEQLVSQAEFSPLDGELRACLLRDVQYLREELARPPNRWRMNVLETVMGWMEGYFDEDADQYLPALDRLRRLLETDA